MLKPNTTGPNKRNAILKLHIKEETERKLQGKEKTLLSEKEPKSPLINQ